MAFQILHGENIATIAITNHRLNPAEAEVHFTFHMNHDVARPEFRGRLMGPRCPYSTTVEIAYPLRPLPKVEQTSPKIVIGRVIIPEPSLWDPVSPFLYQGPIELSSDGKLLVQLRVSHGLRTVQSGAGSFRWNGKPISINAIEVSQTNETQARQWHDTGYNTWRINADDQAPALCDLADRFGFWVLLAVEREVEDARPPEFDAHACFLGCIVKRDSQPNS